MDLAFLLRAERMLAREPVAAIDHGVLVAALAAHQAATPTARATSRGTAEARAAGHDTLAELLAGGPAWREARRAQRGCFRRGLRGKEA